MLARKLFLTGALALALVHAESATGAPPAPPASTVGTPAPQPIQLSQDWDYPELMVAPRASERLEREARIENRRAFALLWPVWAPGLANLSAGILQLSRTNVGADPSKYGAYTGIFVGGGWVVGSYLLTLAYRPYASGLEETSKMPKGTTREQLARERVAEEWIDNASTSGSALRYLSAATNLFVAARLLMTANWATISLYTDATAAAVALTPLIFGTRWNRVSRDQREFKKRIFRPVASTLWVRTSEQTLSPALGLSWNF
jgi:hypothetical protein